MIKPGFVKALAAAGLALAMLAGCGGKGPERDGDRLTNATYHISLEPPRGWHVVNNSQADRMLERGTETVARANNDASLAQDAQQNTTPIFAVMRRPPQPGIDNPSVMVIAENVHSTTVPVKDYLDASRRLMEAVNMGMVGEYGTRTIDGRSFVSMEVHAPGNAATQMYYVDRRGEEMIAVIQTWMNDEGKAQTEAVVNSIKLDW